MPKPQKPTYKASEISQTKVGPDMRPVYQAIVHNPEGRSIMTVTGESTEMVRMFVAAGITAFNKVLGA